MTGKSEAIVIGVCDCGKKFENYTRWLESESRQVRFLRLSVSVQNEDEVDRCDGVVLTGGGDIHPKFFGKPESIIEHDLAEVDERRDAFEFAVVDRAIRGKI